MTYWYTTKVCNTFNTGPGGSSCKRYPRTPNFNVGGVCTARFEGNSADKSLQHRYQNRANIEIGGAGADRRHKVGSCQVHLFLQVSLSAVLQTFVRHLSDGVCFYSRVRPLC